MDGDNWSGINQYVPRGPFKEFHCRDKRWAVMVAHRRAGKTVACVADLVCDALWTKKQDARYAYIAPQFNQAKDVAWLYVKRLTADIPGVTYNEAELRANLPNGAQVRLFGADNPDRLRGLYLDGAILDEHADMKPRVWGEIVRPMLADRAGWAAFIGTPKGHNEFHKVWTEADEEWFKLILRGSESGLLPEKELAAMRKSMTDDQYAQEVECSFEAAIMGAYYGKELALMDREGRITSVRHDPEFPVFTAWDIGRTDDTSIWWYQLVANEIRIIDFHTSSLHDVAFYATQITGQKIELDFIQNKIVVKRGLPVEELAHRTKYRYAKNHLPHDAKAKTLASNRSVIEQLVAVLGMDKVEIVPDIGVQDGINAVRLMLPRVWMDESCDEGIEALRQYQREWDEDKKVFREKPRHDWASNPADAFRMLAVAWREEKRPEVKPAPYFKDIRTTPLNELWPLQSRKQGRI